MTRTLISCGTRSPPSTPAFFLSDSPSVTVTVKVVPLPFSLSTTMFPFISSTMLFVMGMPKPVLPYLLVDDESS